MHNSKTPRENLLIYLRGDDLEWYSNTLSESINSFDFFTDSLGKNFFHDISSSILPEVRLKLYLSKLISVIQKRSQNDLQKYLNGYANIDGDKYTPLHIAIMRHKKVKFN